GGGEQAPARGPQQCDFGRRAERISGAARARDRRDDQRAGLAAGAQRAERHRRQLSVMQIEPQASAFAKRYARGEAQVVWTTLLADLDTPVSASLTMAGGRPMSFLLESVEGGAVRGRYSIIGLEPDLVWRTVNGRAEINRTPRRNGTFTPCNEPPLDALRALVAESRIELP